MSGAHVKAPVNAWTHGVAFAAAAAGLVYLVHIDAPRWFSTTVYMLLGWAAVVPAVKLIAALPRVTTLLIAAGGLCYTVGALVYARKWPNPFPNRFGFHDVFHLLVVAGASVHFVAVVSMVR